MRCCPGRYARGCPPRSKTNEITSSVSRRRSSNRMRNGHPPCFRESNLCQACRSAGDGTERGGSPMKEPDRVFVMRRGPPRFSLAGLFCCGSRMQGSSSRSFRGRRSRALSLSIGEPVLFRPADGAFPHRSLRRNRKKAQLRAPSFKINFSDSIRGRVPPDRLAVGRRNAPFSYLPGQRNRSGERHIVSKQPTCGHKKGHFVGVHQSGKERVPWLSR